MAQKPSIPKGTRDFSPAEMMRRQYIFDTIRGVFRTYGFAPLETPSMENLSTLLGKYGDEGDKLLCKILNSGDYAAGLAPDELRQASKICEKGLRYDLTVPFARYVVQHQGELTFPFKRYQIGKVYRGERAQRGRFREFYQADIDVIGDGQLSILNEAEIPSIIYRTFTALGLQRFQIRVNNRKILNGFYAMQGLTEQAGDIMRTVDKLDKIGAAQVKELLMAEEIGLNAEQAGEIMRFIAIDGSNEEVLQALEGYRGRHPLFDEGLDELTTVARYLSAFGVPQENFKVDLTIARGLDYYTGTVYETTMLDHPEIGSICSGGRYDNLAEYYTDKKLPGVGISIGLTRLFFVLEDQGYLNDQLNTAPADVLILPMTEDLSAAIALATQLRNAGVRTQLYGEQKKFKQKMSYADKLGVPYVIFLGEEEISSGVAAVKNMRTGEQVKLSPDEAVKLIQSGLEQLNQGTPIVDKE